MRSNEELEKRNRKSEKVKGRSREAVKRRRGCKDF